MKEAVTMRKRSACKKMEAEKDRCGPVYAGIGKREGFLRRRLKARPFAMALMDLGKGKEMREVGEDDDGARMRQRWWEEVGGMHELDIDFPGALRLDSWLSLTQQQ